MPQPPKILYSKYDLKVSIDISKTWRLQLDLFWKTSPNKLAEVTSGDKLNAVSVIMETSNDKANRDAAKQH